MADPTIEARSLLSAFDILEIAFSESQSGICSGNVAGEFRDHWNLASHDPAYITSNQMPPPSKSYSVTLKVDQGQPAHTLS